MSFVSVKPALAFAKFGGNFPIDFSDDELRFDQKANIISPKQTSYIFSVHVIVILSAFWCYCSFGNCFLGCVLEQSVWRHSHSGVRVGFEAFLRTNDGKSRRPANG